MPEDKNLFKDLFLKVWSFIFPEQIDKKKAGIAFFVAFLIGFSYLHYHTPPRNFPVGDIVTVNQGESLQAITTSLYDANIIRSTFVFRTAVILLGGEKRVIAGDYLLDKKEGPVDLAYRFVNGKFHLEAKKITIPEGWNIFEISDYLSKSLIKFDKTKFVALAKDKEGYLFPDTYFVSLTSKPEFIIEMMNKNFNEKIKDVPGISTTTYKIKDVIIMASILEREARTMESRKIIAGILWKRLEMKMPLQVDATFDYINGKSTFELTLDDLKIDSPYNTYLYRGLPPGPIGNPGIDAILATINPLKTKYLYFLTDKEGEMHYAKTFDEHKRNKELYLR